MAENTTTGIPPGTSVQAANNVQAQIDRMHSQLALYARDLQHLADAERQKAQALASANARLAILDRLKTDFLAFIAHELRTPLSGMIVLDLLDPNDEPQSLAEMIAILRRGYERLEQFVEKGLEYFKWLAAEEQTDQSTVTDLASVVRMVINHCSGLQEETQRFICEIPETPCLVRGEAGHVVRVVQVLLDNAQKFSEEDRPILIHMSRDHGRVALPVTDHGRGFAPEMGAELLRPFTIANVRHHTQGTGLSLALVNAITTTYGGKLHAHSGGIGQGATFTVELPEVSLL